MDPKPTTIYIESTPNPNTMKFVANYLLVEPSTFIDITNVENAKSSPLASKLFKELPWVEEVFFLNNYITLTKKEEADWIEVQGSARELITKSLTQGIEIGNASYEKSTSPKLASEELPISSEKEEIITKIKDILDEYIRPAVEQDGGAISFHSFDKGLVKVLLQGSCSGCPSSTITLKAGIEALLKRAIPAVETVEALEG